MLHDWKKSKHKWPQWALLEPYHWQSLPSFSTIIFLIKSDAVFFFFFSLLNARGSRSPRPAWTSVTEDHSSSEMAKSPRVLLSCSMVASSPLAALKAHFTLNWKWYWTEVTHFCAWKCEPLRCCHCNWIGPTPSHQGSESKDHLWHQNPEPRAL